MTIINASRGTSKQYVDAQDDLRTRAINDEKTRAEGVEAGLRTDVNANSAAITTEKNRATAAEAALNGLVGTTASYGTVTQAVLDDAKDYTDEQITQRVTQVYSIQGSCTYTQLLAKTGQEKGNVWNVTTANYGYKKDGVEVPEGTGGATWSELQVGDPSYVPPGTNWVWTGTAWDAMGGSIDLSTYETTSAVNTKLTEYSKTTAINGVLAQHQNIIKKAQVTVRANDATVSGKTYSVRDVTGANTEVLIVSPEPASIQSAVDCGLYASASGSGTITFTSDIAPASDVTFDVTIISTAAGTQIS